MNKAKHTKGPWHTKLSHSDGDDLISVDAINRHITLHVIEGDEDIANARLIAAAPELLRALEELLELVESSDMSSRDLPEHEYASIADEAETQAREAIKKAKGEVL